METAQVWFNATLALAKADPNILAFWDGLDPR
jgi:hypothetical protein